MIDRHAVRAVTEAGSTSAEVARQFGVSQRTVQRILQEGEVESADDSKARRARGVGRPRVGSAVSERLVALMTEDPKAPPLELLRQLREEGTELGTSTFYRLHARARDALPVELMVRFEGVAGEFAQFDFGQVDVRLRAGGKKRIRFAAYRLKYSRWVHVAVVDNERVESLVRALLSSFEAAGGVPLRVVFDRPKTVVVGQDGDRPIWNTTLAQVAIDYGFSIELCAPRSPRAGRLGRELGWLREARLLSGPSFRGRRG